MLIPPPAIKPAIYVNLSAATPLGFGFWAAVAAIRAQHGPIEIVFGPEPKWMEWMRR